MSINRSGTDAQQQTQLQNAILEIYPEGLPKFGADGDFGGEGQAAFKRIMDSSPEEFKEILEEMKIDADVDLSVEQAIAVLEKFQQQNPDFKVSPETTLDVSDCHEIEERHIQTLINVIDPGALKVDGSFGKGSQEALQKVLDNHAEILAEKGIEVGGKMQPHHVIDALNAIAEEPQEFTADGTGGPIKDAPKEDIKSVQNLIRVLDPDAMSKRGIDGLYGPKTEEALKGVLPEGADLATMSMNDIIAKLEEKVTQLPERHIVDQCDNLTEIAREHYAEDIKQYTQELLDNPDSGFTTEKAARVHAEQIAVTKIAMADGNSEYKFTEGDNAHTIHKGQVIEIPDAGPLKDVDGSLDWEALDAKVGPGGPCGCDGESPMAPSPRDVTSNFTPVATHKPTPGLPHRVELSDTCWAELDGTSRGFLGAGEERPRYSIKGEELNGEYGILTRKLQEMGHNVRVRSNGSCDFPHEGGDDNDDNKNENTTSDTPAPDTPSVPL